MLWETILRKQISILAHARNSESQTKQSAICLKVTLIPWDRNVREAAVGSLHFSGKTSEQRHKRIAKLIIYLNKLRRSNIQEDDPIARFSF